MSNAGCNHRVELQCTNFFSQQRPAGSRVQFHGDQVFNNNTCVPLVGVTEAVGCTKVHVEPTLFGLILVVIEFVVFETGNRLGVLERAQFNVFR